MAEYIEREARYIDIKKVTIPRGFFNQDLNVPKLFDWLESQPAVDVVEVRHGKWQPCFEDWREQIKGDECSICGFRHYGIKIRNFLFCPNCGAKMDGKVGVDDV